MTDIESWILKELLDQETEDFKLWNDPGGLIIYQEGIGFPIITTSLNSMAMCALGWAGRGFMRVSLMPPAPLGYVLPV